MWEGIWDTHLRQVQVGRGICPLPTPAHQAQNVLLCFFQMFQKLNVALPQGPPPPILTLDQTDYISTCEKLTLSMQCSDSVRENSLGFKRESEDTGGFRRGGGRARVTRRALAVQVRCRL